MNTRPSRLLRSAAALGLLTLCVACGVAREAEAPKSGVEEPEAPAQEAAPTSLRATSDDALQPATLAEAEQLLEQARADLERLALGQPGAAPPAAAGAPAPVAPAEPARDKKRAESSADAAEAESSAPPAKAESACETACKAFASLERASDAVCRLDADGGQRCQRARRIREDAARRVASCGCSK